MSNDPQPHPARSTEGMAKPFTPITATVNNRRTGDTATKKENVVWNPEEVKTLPVDKDEKRARPDFEVASRLSRSSTSKKWELRMFIWE